MKDTTPTRVAALPGSAAAALIPPPDRRVAEVLRRIKVVIAIPFADTGHPIATGGSSVQALIVRGGWDGHEPVACTELFREFLGAHDFDMRVADSLDVYTEPGDYDLIVQCWTGARFTAEQEKGLVGRVRAGTGFAGWHGGIVATGYEAPDYQFMVGGRFVCHPGGFVDHTVDIVSEHPIVAGLSGYDVHTEQYFLHVDPTLDVLATTTFTGDHGAPETAGAVVPVAWTRRFGAGRVFVCTLGHSPADLLVPQTRKITERGMLWACGIVPDHDRDH